MTPNTNIFTKLVEWGDERFISSQACDKNGYVCNVVSELGEYLSAETEDDLVDAVADIVVFSVTEMPKLGLSKEYIGMLFSKVKESNVSYYGKDFTKEITLVLQKIVDGELTEASIIDILNICFDTIESMDYNIDKTLEETHLEINSRLGAWNEEVKKWKKFTDDHHKSLWIKADYSKAKNVYNDM